MIENIRKTERQQEGFNKWRYSKQFGALENGMGTMHWVGAMGKTYATVRFGIKPYLEARHEDVVIIVPRIELRKQWAKVIRGLIDPQHLKRIFINTVQGYLAARAEFSCGLFIVDELHMFYGDEFIKYINNTNIKFKFCIGLTATPYDPEGKWKQVEKYFKVIDKVSPEEALEKGFISRFTEYNLGFNLEEAEREWYDNISEEIAKQRGKFATEDDKYGYFLALKCVAGGKHDNGNTYSAGQWAMSVAQLKGWYPGCPAEIDDQLNPNKLIGFAKILMKATHERKSFLENHPRKIEIAQQILDKFAGEKTIIFGEAVEFADRLHEKNLELGRKSVIYHSALKSRPMLDENGEYITYKSGAKAGQPKLFGTKLLRDFAINEVRNGEANIIVAAKALDVGFDVEDMRVGIITSRNSNANNQQQRTFRVFRINPNETGERVMIVNLFVRDTKDEQYLRKAQMQTSFPIYTVTSVDELQFEPKYDDFDL